MAQSYSTLSTSWKVYKIEPVPKAGDPHSIRTITPFCCCLTHQKSLNSKSITKLSRILVKPSIHISLVLPKNCSTPQQMLIFLDHIINSPLQTDVIYFNISKAFDTVSHSILLNKMWCIGITGVLWTWFKDYLWNCYQRVIVTLIYCLYSFRCAKGQHSWPFAFLNLHQWYAIIYPSQPIPKICWWHVFFMLVPALSDNSALQENSTTLLTCSTYQSIRRLSNGFHRTGVANCSLDLFWRAMSWLL